MKTTKVKKLLKEVEEVSKECDTASYENDMVAELCRDLINSRIYSDKLVTEREFLRGKLKDIGEMVKYCL